MPSARTSMRGAFLNWRLAVYGIQKADASRLRSSRLFMETSLLLACGQGYPLLQRENLRRIGYDLLFLLAQALDSEGHHVARLEEHGVGLDAQAYTRRRPGTDDVPGE